MRRLLARLLRNLVLRFQGLGKHTGIEETVYKSHQVVSKLFSFYHRTREKGKRGKLTPSKPIIRPIRTLRILRAPTGVDFALDHPAPTLQPLALGALLLRLARPTRILIGACPPPLRLA